MNGRTASAPMEARNRSQVGRPRPVLSNDTEDGRVRMGSGTNPRLYRCPSGWVQGKVYLLNEEDAEFLVEAGGL